MRNPMFLVLLLSFNSLTMDIFSQTTYYFDSVVGNDLNTGTSASSPWKTTDKFNSSVPAGAIALFRRDRIWEDGSFLSLKPGITVGKYGATGARPIISNLKEILENATWTSFPSIHGTIWETPYSENISRLFLTESGGPEQEYLVSTLKEDVGRMTEGSLEKWFQDSTKLYIRSDANPAIEYPKIRSSANLYAVSIINADGAKVIDVDIRGGVGPSVYINNSDNVLIDHCTIGKYAGDGVRAFGGSTNLTISENWIDSEFSFTYGRGSDTTISKSGEYRGIGDGINFSGEVTNSSIKDNRIKDWGHTGIEFYGHDANTNGVNDNSITGNYITNVNLSYGRGIGTDGLEGKCQNNEFKSNIIRDCKAPIQFNGNDNTFHHNIVYGTKNSSVYPNQPTGKGITLSVYGAALVCEGNRIDNNVIMNNEDVDIEIRNYYVQSNSLRKYVKNNSIRNNIVYTNLTQDPNSIALKVYDQETVQSNNFLNNLFYSDLDPNGQIIDYRGQLLTVMNFNTTTPEQNDIITANLSADPLIDESQNYIVSHNSVCINAGTAISYSTDDFDGDTFPVGNPDIGMQEYNPSSEGLLDHSVVSELGIVLYPNPSSRYISIQINAEILNAEIYNSYGNHIDLPMHQNKINISDIPKGLYFIKIRSNQGNWVKQFIKN